jgi:hypothetical protein
MKTKLILPFLSIVLAAAPSWTQSLGNTGTITGSVVDPSGAVVGNAEVSVHNPVTGYTQSVVSGSDGSLRLLNLPPTPYHLEVKASGFSPYSQDVEIRNSVPVQVKVALTLPGVAQEVTVVEAGATEAIENDPSAHVDVDRNLILKMPSFDPSGSLSQAITFSTGGVAADGNGFFHPLGDHAQASFLIDGQPISDQQSKVFSTQLPTSAIQSMEVITGTPAAEFGDKSSLIAQVTTRSGLGSDRLFGSIQGSYGTFGTGAGSIGLGYGNAKLGNFIAIDGNRSGRFLDTPEFAVIHDVGNGETIFDRLDYQPNNQDVLHLNLFTGRNWLQTPNSYDQLPQDQHQRVLTWNVAPGYQHTFSAKTLLSINPFIRKDQFNYYPSRDPFADFPATQSSNRHLLNWGVRADVAMTNGHHSLKYGIDLKQTRLLENFGFGVTDPGFNSPCIDSTGATIPDPTLTDPSQCAKAGFEPNTPDNPDIVGAPFCLCQDYGNSFQ